MYLLIDNKSNSIAYVLAGNACSFCRFCYFWLYVHPRNFRFGWL